MVVLKDKNCNLCGGLIVIVPFTEDNETIVSHGECVNCGKNLILPQEKYRNFVLEHCINVQTY